MQCIYDSDTESGSDLSSESTFDELAMEWQDTDDVDPFIAEQNVGPDGVILDMTGPTLIDLNGPPGFGPFPTQPLVGQGPPDADLGEDGSFYVNEIANQVYLKSEQGWFITNLNLVPWNNQYCLSLPSIVLH